MPSHYLNETACFDLGQWNEAACFERIDAPAAPPRGSTTGCCPSDCTRRTPRPAPRVATAQYIGRLDAHNVSLGQAPIALEALYGQVPIAPEALYGQVPIAPEALYGQIPIAPEALYGQVPTAPEALYGQVPIAPEALYGQGPTVPEALHGQVSIWVWG
jgi:hypothetical protein